MILGVGMDLVDVAAFREQLEQPGTRFVQGMFSHRELRDVRERGAGDQALRLAARFAAKEAFIKAWSSAIFGQEPVIQTVDWHEIEVVHDAWGRPALKLHGEVARHIAQLGDVATHVSLTHDGPVAGAYVVLEAPHAAGFI